MRRHVVSAWIVILAVLLSGCASLFWMGEKPHVDIVNVTPKEMRLLEQTFLLELRIQNPTDTDLDINGMSIELDINGQPFARGVSNESLKVERMSTKIVQVEAYTGLTSILRQLYEVKKGSYESGFRYLAQGVYSHGRPVLPDSLRRDGGVQVMPHCGSDRSDRSGKSEGSDRIDRPEPCLQQFSQVFLSDEQRSKVEASIARIYELFLEHVAAARGKVTFAGWKSNGGGYQVWISHAGGVYTTYNHMAGVSVGAGQYVARGQQVGRLGSSGYATGPHLHFEVWRGPIWNGGSRINPLRYL